MNPLLSVVVPTKNRYIYLENFVNSFAAFNSSEIEIIIQDNSDVQSVEFLDFLNGLNDQRIKYAYKSGWVSVVENCDLGIDAATGAYVCMLGDDDGMSFNLSLEVVKYCQQHSHDAAIVNKAEYYWPDTSHAVWKDLLAGNLFYKNYTYQVRPISAENELSAVLQEGAANSLRALPRVYHGFVKKETLRELKTISGSYFPGPSPDMANAIGLARVVKNMVEIDAPAVISGHSKKSTGGMGGEKKHHGKIEHQSHLPKETSSLWSNKIPKFWSGATIYAESAKEALARTKSPKCYQLNYAYLWAFCLVFERHYLSEILPIIKKNPSKIPLVIGYVTSLTWFRATNFAKNYFKFNNKSNLSIKSNDIANAQINLNKLIGDVKLLS